ncbi:uncharacterized protein LOC123987753 [Osmia bicornis bicornis]|uniref:uncharacterized protein LOC123987753 n=1 Tax=Osmia bicornis bicornis TaxID=1437191 RepID=UPI001EAED8E1|nr:uncharacterized protein LOC123987753 [Osmia bicornis bicornis]
MSTRKYNLCSLPASKESAVSWAREKGLLRTTKNCSTHRRPMRLYAGGEHGLGRFRCPAGRGNCKQYAATVDSFFQDVRLPLHKAIKLMYCFTSDFSYEVTATEVSDVGEDQEVLSTDTIAAWFRYCREMIVDHVCKMQAGKPKLGGIDEGGSAIVVQIDEGKFGKRKYNRGRIIDGHWRQT